MKLAMISLLAAAMLGLAGGEARAQEEPTGLSDFSGKPRSLDEYTGKGKWTIVVFWAHDCVECNREAESYEQFYQRHKGKDAIMLGLSIDGAAQKRLAAGFVKRHKLTFPNLIGEPEDVTALFTMLTGVQWIGTPTFLIYNPTGRLVAQQIGAVPVALIEDFIRKKSTAQPG